MNYTLYVDLQGDDREHAESLEKTVCDLVKGIGLAWRSDTDKKNGVWPPMTSHFRVDHQTVRLAFDWDHKEKAIEAGQVLHAWLETNLWVHHEVLLNVFVLDETGATAEKGVIFGEALGFISLYNKVTAEV